jgi:hypothetical protein
MQLLIEWLNPTFTQPTNVFVIIEYKIIYIVNLIIVYWL